MAYSNSFRAGFTLDNEYIILHNPAVQAATSANMDLIINHTYWWPTSESGLYRPVTTLSYLLNYAILGNQQNPFGYHLINFLLHCVNILLVYLLARRFIHGAWLPELIAIAWAVHPALTESITNIVGRADLLAGAAILGGFLLYLKSVEATGWTRIACLASLFVITTIGVFSKENAVTLLGVVILYELVFRREKNTLREVTEGCVAIIIPILLLLYQRARLLAINPAQPVPFLENPLIGASFLRGKLTAIAILSRYVGKLVWPASLSADYSFNQIPMASGSAYDWIAWAAIALVLVAAIFLFMRNKTAFFFVALAFIVFIPTSNLLFNIDTIMAERFLYLPAIAFIACLAFAIRWLSERSGIKALTPIAMALIIACLGIRTWVRNKDWRDDFSLATASVKASAESFKTHMALSLYYYKNDPGRNIDAAIAEAEKSLAILKDVPDNKSWVIPYLNAESDYRMKGDISLKAGQSSTGGTSSQEATHAYQRALEILLRAVPIDKKAGEKQRALEIQHGTPESQIVPVATPHLYYHLAQTYLSLRDANKAYKAALYARALAPGLSETSLLTAQAAASTGNINDAAVALMVGYLITRDNAFLPRLNSLYKSGLDPKGCGLASTPNGPILNSTCEPVHAEICSAYADIIQIFQWNLKQDIADQTKSVAIRDFGCTVHDLDAGKRIQEFP
ncbi:MAG TPA: hypothetical protein VLV89_01845 [Candidatus Acidoferrum sp.]|nr:hypothetical protein [Candidatus Acidoferrum sp.]